MLAGQVRPVISAGLPESARLTLLTELAGTEPSEQSGPAGPAVPAGLVQTAQK